ncbi:hypothetical protein TNCV_404171 [Trichonephila clavipes]|nr:hypothetical protein TNCV_404171 [Trichonephila clavipes]
MSVGIRRKHHLLPADYMQDTCGSFSILFTSKFIRLLLDTLEAISAHETPVDSVKDLINQSFAVAYKSTTPQEATIFPFTV